MLWVHVGVDGSIDCQVNVGNKVRQGNGFELFIVTETNNVENFEINRVGYIKPGEQEIVSLNVPVRREENIEFELNRPSQANSFFKGGATYNGYMASIPPEATTFYGNGGHIQLVIYAVSVDGRSENTQNVTVFVEPTYGNKYVGISDTDYGVLLRIIDDFKNGKLDSKNPIIYDSKGNVSARFTDSGLSIVGSSLTLDNGTWGFTKVIKRTNDITTTNIGMLLYNFMYDHGGYVDLGSAIFLTSERNVYALSDESIEYVKLSDGEIEVNATVADYLTKNRADLSTIDNIFVPYTGANKDINIGNHSFTMGSVFTVESESSVYTQTTPGSIVLKNPIGTLSIGTYSLTVNGTTIYWPTLSADPNGKYLALRSDIPSIDDYLSPTSTNAVQNKTISEIATKIPVNIPKKTYSIPSWVSQLGPHFNKYCLGHMCFYDGYTTSDYICVNATDELTLSILEGITQIRVSKYSLNDLDKIDTYLGIDTYSSTTTIVFSEKMLIKISVRGTNTPSIALAESAVSLKSYREKEDIFVYPYGPWDYNKQYIMPSAPGITETLTPGPNGDPYWNTVANGFYLESWRALPNKMGMSINMNYSYIKYGLVSPSLIRTAYWKKNDICRLKFGIMTLDASLLKTTYFMNMSTSDSASISEMVYTGAYSNLAYEKCLVRLELDNSPSTDFITTREQGDELFNSVFVRFGLTYDGEEVDLSKGTKRNTLKISPKGTFPFVSTQTGGQKPSCFAEYKGKLFVGCDGFGFNILNLDDLSLVATIEDSSLGHINNSEFMEEFFSSDDAYPLMLEARGAESYNPTLGSDYSGYFNAMRFANDLSGLTIVRKYTIPTAISGFYTSGFSYDRENKTLWVLAYKRRSYSSEADNNCLVLTSWDLSNCTQNQNGDYIPAVKTRCELTFVRTLQDTTFCNGYIFALADSKNSGKIPSELYIVDTVKQTIRKTDISRISGLGEIEAITNVYDESLDKYYLLIGEALFTPYGGVNGTYGHVYRLDTADTIK